MFYIHVLDIERQSKNQYFAFIILMLRESGRPDSHNPLEQVFSGVCLCYYTCILLAIRFSNTLISAGLERSARYFHHCRLICRSLAPFSGILEVLWVIVKSREFDGSLLKFV
jgi:hypothetical protein